MSTHRRFVLKRHADVTGVSGIGIVAEGVEFSDGTVALRWTSAWPTSVVFHDKGIEAVEAIHGHNGATEIAYLDTDDHDELIRQLDDCRGDIANALAEHARKDFGEYGGEKCGADMLDWPCPTVRALTRPRARRA